ncbi:MAG: NAD-dependent epimerase/dehydratase family protein [Verrucomicrobiae bacterium]|nr:NAD-dependent epimerase/dehydratase family protein [Verrucomicrobiae bacterium]
MKTVLVTGSSGLIGSETARHFHALGWKCVGMDNNMRARFFGPDGDTEWNRRRLVAECPRFQHVEADIRDRDRVLRTIAELKPDLIVHCAAQPSHDLAAKIPFEDFDVNAVGTHNLLEATRRGAPEAVFVFMSTNKVYGDRPNLIPLRELPTRWDYADPKFAGGIPEDFPIDQSTHSIFGASKVAADVMAQEYGRYFGMKVGVFRGGCLTGAAHSGAKLHGFLAWLFKTALSGGRYQILGYKGKQVRDQIHSHDVAAAFHAFYENPRAGEVYNLGGGKENSASILECLARIETMTGRRIETEYTDTNRVGDHICYYSDLTKMRRHFPGWRITRDLDAIFEDFHRAALAERA